MNRPVLTGTSISEFAASKGIAIASSGSGSRIFTCQAGGVLLTRAADIIRDTYPARLSIRSSEEFPDGKLVSFDHSPHDGRLVLTVHLIAPMTSEKGLVIRVSVGKYAGTDYDAEASSPVVNRTNEECVKLAARLRELLMLDALKGPRRGAKVVEVSGSDPDAPQYTGRMPHPHERVGGPDAHGWGSWQD